MLILFTQMVLDSGKIVRFEYHLLGHEYIIDKPLFQIEFDSPQELLQKKGGAFKGMVDGSGDKKALYTMAERRVVT